MSIKSGCLSCQETTRLRAGDLIARGFDDVEMMDILEVSRSSLYRWRKKVNGGGLKSLERAAGSGKPSTHTTSQLEELKNILIAGSRAAGYLTDRWTSRVVADLIRKKWAVNYCRSNVRRILNDLGFSYKKPNVKSTKHSQEVIDTWRAHDWQHIKKKQMKRD
jgi:transposase